MKTINVPQGGKLGDIVASKNHSGPCLRKHSPPRKKPTYSQTHSRGEFGGVAKAWDTLTDVVWIGYIQWLRANGYGFPAEPILKRLTANFRCADALFTDWPEVDFIVGNPPFLRTKQLRGELGSVVQPRAQEILCRYNLGFTA